MLSIYLLVLVDRSCLLAVKIDSRLLGSAHHVESASLLHEANHVPRLCHPIFDDTTIHDAYGDVYGGGDDADDGSGFLALLE